jgi:radical SAM protein with 4Fe4S-binding SPASM domain
MTSKYYDSDFVSSGYIANLTRKTPETREEFLGHIQKIYNYKLHTDFPLVLHIEPTNKCNQVCRMCIHPTQKRDEAYTSDAIVEKAISEAKLMKPWSTHFFFFGEPFLNKSLFRYIKIAKEAGLTNISTTTNLTALTKSKITKIPNSGLDSIHISFEGLNRKHYNEVRGKDSFEKAKNNLLFLIAEKQRLNSNLWISITFVRTTESEEEIFNFKNYWGKLVNDIHISPQFEYRNGSVDGSRRQQISTIQLVRNNGNIMFSADKDRVPCRQLWTRIVVTSQGELVPCSQNIDAELSLGNIMDTTIHAAWTGELMKSLRSQHICNSFTTVPGNICKGCTDWDWSGKVDKRPEIIQALSV